MHNFWERLVTRFDKFDNQPTDPGPVKDLILQEAAGVSERASGSCRHSHRVFAAETWPETQEHHILACRGGQQQLRREASATRKYMANGRMRSAGRPLTTLLLLGCSLLATYSAPRAEARPGRDLRQVNESLPPGQSITDVVSSLIGGVRALAPENSIAGWPAPDWTGYRHLKSDMVPIQALKKCIRGQSNRAKLQRAVSAGAESYYAALTCS